jgi:hypothetical protein
MNATPAQMAIPLQMEFFLKQLVAAIPRTEGLAPKCILKE